MKNPIVTNPHALEGLSEANRQRWKEGNIGKKGKPCIVNGKQYTNGKQAANHLKINESTVRIWIRCGKHGAKYL